MAKTFTKGTKVLTGAHFKWSGVNELKKTFNAFAVQLGPDGPPEMRERVKDILMPTAEKLRDTAKSLAPFRTGRLRNAIVAERSPSGKQGVNVFVKKRTKDGGAWYGRLVEKGTSKMAAKPFFRPAIRAIRPQVVPDISKGLKSLIEEMAQRLGYKAAPPS